MASGTETYPDDDTDLPEYLDVADIVRVSKLSANVVREHLKGLGCVEKIGNKLRISTHDLRDRWPSLYRKLLAKAAEGMDLRPERAPPQRRALTRRISPVRCSTSWHFVTSRTGRRALQRRSPRKRRPSPLPLGPVAPAGCSPTSLAVPCPHEGPTARDS